MRGIEWEIPPHISVKFIFKVIACARDRRASESKKNHTNIDSEREESIYGLFESNGVIVVYVCLQSRVTSFLFWFFFSFGLDVALGCYIFLANS